MQQTWCPPSKYASWVDLVHFIFYAKIKLNDLLLMQLHTQMYLKSNKLFDGLT